VAEIRGGDAGTNLNVHGLEISELPESLPVKYLPASGLGSGRI
jgi:hypothetical protein